MENKVVKQTLKFHLSETITLQTRVKQKEKLFRLQNEHKKVHEINTNRK